MQAPLSKIVLQDSKTSRVAYQDTILLLLLKEEFQTMSGFMAWLDGHGIRKEFGSWA